MTDNLSWASPLFFTFFLFLLVLLAWLWFRKKHRSASVLFSKVSVLRKIDPGFRARLIRVPFVLKLIGLALVIFSLARPQKSDEQVKKNVDGIDIMIALDISDSMLIEDMPPAENRLESAKTTILNFIKKRTTDRIGVVIFAGESFTLVPLTLDYELLSSRISEVLTARQSRIKDGTAIGVALANASGRLRESVAKSRVVIFMTDGENNSGTIDPETGLEIAKGYGVKIYSIGVGRSGPTQIPVIQNDIFGNPVKTYQPFESTVNDDLLGRFASDTGGKYWKAEKGNILEDVFSQIDSLEKTKIDINKYTRYTELYMNPLIWGMVLLLSAQFLSVTILRKGP